MRDARGHRSGRGEVQGVGTAGIRVVAGGERAEGAEQRPCAGRARKWRRLRAEAGVGSPVITRRLCCRYSVLYENQGSVMLLIGDYVVGKNISRGCLSNTVSRVVWLQMRNPPHTQHMHETENMFYM